LKITICQEIQHYTKTNFHLRLMKNDVAKWSTCWDPSFKRLMEPLHPSSSVIEKEDVVSHIQLVISDHHSSCRIPGFNLLHELNEFISVLPDFAREIFRNIDVATFEKASFSENLFFVTVVNQANLKLKKGSLYYNFWKGFLTYISFLIIWWIYTHSLWLWVDSIKIITAD